MLDAIEIDYNSLVEQIVEKVMEKVAIAEKGINTMYKIYCPFCSNIIPLNVGTNQPWQLFSKRHKVATAYCDCCGWLREEFGRTERQAVEELEDHVHGIRKSRVCGNCVNFILKDETSSLGQCSFPWKPYGNLQCSKDGKLLMNLYRPISIHSWVNCGFFCSK